MVMMQSVGKHEVVGVTNGEVAAVEYNGEMVSLNDAAMRVDFPYALQISGVPLVAVKRKDGSVDFFAVPPSV